MIKLETMAKILLTVLTIKTEEDITGPEIASVLFEVEKLFNNVGVVEIDGVRVGVRVHISGDMPKYYNISPKKKWTGKVPERCDGCGDLLEDTFIEGKTIFGSWAIMCENCHTTHGVGLGLGKGQKYDLKTLEKIEG